MAAPPADEASHEAAAADGAVNEPAASGGTPSGDAIGDATAASSRPANGLPNGLGKTSGISSSGSSSDSGDSSDSDSGGGRFVRTAATTAGVGAAEAGGHGSSGPETASSLGEDVYDEAETDPAKCRALNSSLWEVAALRSHYDPQVPAAIALCALTSCTTHTLWRCWVPRAGKAHRPCHHPDGGSLHVAVDDQGCLPCSCGSCSQGDTSRVQMFTGVPDKDPAGLQLTACIQHHSTAGLVLLTALWFPWHQVAAFTSVLDKDLADKRRTAEVDIAPLLAASYSSRIQVEIVQEPLGLPDEHQPQQAICKSPARQCCR